MRFQILLITVLGIVFASCVQAFNGATDGRIRRCLLIVLKRYHLGLGPLDTHEPTSERKGALNSIPFALKDQHVVPFIDTKSLFSLSCANRSFHDLRTFDPYFVTDDHLVNKLLFDLLRNHFPRSKSRSSTRFQDELELFTLKFNFDFASITDEIPSSIVYYLLCFLHEVTYGLDAPVPTSKELGKIHFVRQMRLNNLPLSFEYFIWEIDHRSHLDDESEILPWLDNFHFFNTKPISYDIKLRFNIRDEVTYDKVMALTLQNEFSVAICEMLLDEFSNEILENEHSSELQLVSEFLTEYCSFSLKAYYKTEMFPIESDEYHDFRFMKALVIRLEQNNLIAHNDSDLRFVCCDSVNQFQFVGIELDLDLIDVILLFAIVQIWSLANLEMLSQLINLNDFMSLMDLNRFLSEIFKASNTILSELVVKESTRPLSKQFLPPRLKNASNVEVEL